MFKDALFRVVDYSVALWILPLVSSFGNAAFLRFRLVGHIGIVCVTQQTQRTQLIASNT